MTSFATERAAGEMEPGRPDRSTEVDDDRTLLQTFAARRGSPASEAAFARLVARHERLVRSTCWRITRDRHLVDDATQATFVVLARRAEGLVEADSLAGWLYVVATRVARQGLKTERRRAWRSLDGVDSPARSEGSSLDRSELAEALSLAIDRLPGRYREVVALRHVAGLSQAEAARRLELPEGTVESRLHRARARLRSVLRRRGFAPGAMAFGARLSPRVVLHFVQRWIRRIAMQDLGWIAALMIGGTACFVGATGASPAADQGPRPASVPTTNPPTASTPRDASTLAREWDRAARGLILEQVGIAITFHPERRRAGEITFDSVGAIRTSDPAAVTTTEAVTLAEMARLAREMVAHAEADPTTPESCNLASLLAGSFYLADLDPQFSDPTARALRLLAVHHAANPKLEPIGRTLARFRPTAASLQLFRARATATTTPASRGVALFQLGVALESAANYLTVARNHDKKAIAGELTATPGQLPSKLPDTIRGYFVLDPATRAAFDSTTPAELHREAMTTLDRVLRDHSDVPYARIGDGSLSDRLVSAGQTLGSATLELFAQRLDLFPGSPAPPVSAIDAEGRPIRLADRAGHVVLLLTDPSEATRLASGRPGLEVVVIGRDWTEVTIIDGERIWPFPRPSRPMAMVVDGSGTIRYQGGITPLLDGILDNPGGANEATALNR